MPRRAGFHLPEPAGSRRSCSFVARNNSTLAVSQGKRRGPEHPAEGEVNRAQFHFVAHRAETQDGAASHSAEADMRYLKKVSTLTFAEARVCVLDRVRSHRRTPSADEVGLVAANGRVLAEEVRADR